MHRLGRICIGPLALILAADLGCQTKLATSSQEPRAEAQTTVSAQPTEADTARPRRDTYTPRPYPLDERGFSPVDEALAIAFAREEDVADDDEGSLSPYVLKLVSAYPLDGSYPYHCSRKPREYDIYNGVTQDMWYKGMVVAKAYPDGSRCSYCCGLTFEIFIRAMKLRNVHKGLDPDDFNGMTFHDLFNLLQLWYIEGEGDSPQLGIVSYGLGKAITNFEDARPGDFADYSTVPADGHSIIFIDWIRDGQGGIVGMKYFSSNLSGTRGVGYGSGMFSDCNNGKGILRKSVRIARVGSIENYKPFDRLRIPCRNAYAPNQPEQIIREPTSHRQGE